MKLTPQQVQTFEDDGYLVAERVVTDADLAPVIAEFEQWIDAQAKRLHADGKVTDLAEGQSFERRFATLYAQTPEIGAGMDIMFMRGPATFAFLRNKNLLDAVECLVGPEILCNPIQHVRAKPPSASSGTGAGFFNVPWHQDAGVTWEEADNTHIVTCWLALVDATVENGCMEVMPRVENYLEHQAEGGTTIRPDLLPTVEPRAVPVKKGGLVFMHRWTPHRSTPNFTPDVRWSLDLRYQQMGTPTGRPFHPAFVARSASHPESVLTDHAEWSRLWTDALEKAQGVQAHRVK
ncbi:MAG: phytanoyl-CoA dioxygenase family protein [Armatimonadota bacterium]|nr:phytanoyl-CoA dioxygenase family protein [Armatimonadota bacterium]